MTNENTHSERLESNDAKSYWKSTDQMGLGYGDTVPHYADTISTVIALLRPSSVLEFGCNAGRNLKLISEKSEPSVDLAGVDINEKSIRYGTEHHGLDLKVGDERSLCDYPDNRWDVVFTVSVLDHIPDPTTTCIELTRVSGRYLLLCEPYIPGVAGRIDNEVPAGGCSNVAPFSYYHDYYGILHKMGLTRVIDITLPTSERSVGMSYRMMLYTKGEDKREQRENVLGSIMRL